MTPVLEVQGLQVWFPVRQGLIDQLRGRPRAHVRAVDDVAFAVAKGETLALVGESGSGKTTVARAVTGLLREAEGRILFEGRDLATLGAAERGRLGTRIQMVFQDPFDAINPRERVERIVTEPLQIHHRDLDRAGMRERAARALRDVGLEPPEDFLDRYPHELSGGQRQRLLIACALILEPDLIIADEPVSMLDASLKVEILNLLSELRRRHELAILMITHDLALTRYVAERIAIMYLGRIVESGPTEAVLADPRHPYTRALVEVVPTLDTLGREKHALEGEIPHPSEIPPGCRFHPRCPIAIDRCRHEDPETESFGGGRTVACHRAFEGRGGS